MWLGRCGWVAPRGAQAADAARRAVALFRAAGSRIDLGRALWRQAWQHILAGDLAAAAHPLDEAEDLLRGERPSKALVSCLRARAVFHLRGNRPDAARAILEQALAIARRLRSPRDVALTLGSMAEFHCAGGRMGEAIAVAQEALASLGPAQARFPWVQHIAGAIASYRLAQGDIAGARPIIAERLAAARLMALPHEVAANLERLALIAAVKGSLAAAARLSGYVRSCHVQRGILRSFGAQAVWCCASACPRTSSKGLRGAAPASARRRWWRRPSPSRRDREAARAADRPAARCRGTVATTPPGTRGRSSAARHVSAVAEAAAPDIRL